MFYRVSACQIIPIHSCLSPAPYFELLSFTDFLISTWNSILILALSASHSQTSFLLLFPQCFAISTLRDGCLSELWYVLTLLSQRCFKTQKLRRQQFQNQKCSIQFLIADLHSLPPSDLASLAHRSRFWYQQTTPTDNKLRILFLRASWMLILNSYLWKLPEHPLSNTT